MASAADPYTTAARATVPAPAIPSTAATPASENGRIHETWPKPVVAISGTSSRPAPRDGSLGHEPAPGPRHGSKQPRDPEAEQDEPAEEVGIERHDPEGGIGGPGGATIRR